MASARPRKTTPRRFLEAGLLAVSIFCAQSCAVILITCGISKLSDPWSFVWQFWGEGDPQLMVEPSRLHVCNFIHKTSEGLPIPLRGPFRGPPPVREFNGAFLGFEAHYDEQSPSNVVWSVTFPVKPLLVCLVFVGVVAQMTRRRVELPRQPAIDAIPDRRS